MLPYNLILAHVVTSGGTDRTESAAYGVPGLRERNLGAPRAIRLLIKILKEIYCGAP